LPFDRVVSGAKLVRLPSSRFGRWLAKRVAALREHIRAESEQDMDTLIAGMTQDCFNDVAGVNKPFDETSRIQP
jgi:hypothetical protein